jgi:hypothetical protein
MEPVERLIDEFVEVSNKVVRHLQEQRALTSSQREALSISIISLQNRLASWMRHDMESRSNK